jgi:hypothetical protein
MLSVDGRRGRFLHDHRYQLWQHADHAWRGANDYLFIFTNPGSSPQQSASVDADAAYGQVQPGDNQTAWSATLDASTIAAIDANAPAPLASDAFGNLIAGTHNPPNGPNLAGAASWARSNVCPDWWCNNRYQNDCTDFVSRALHLGGSFPYVTAPQGNAKDLDQWYYNKNHKVATYTWAGALYLADMEKRYGTYFYHFAKKSTSTSNIIAGSPIFASMTGTHFYDISHAGVVTKVMGRNLIITQHTRNVTEPLWATAVPRSF